MSKKLSKFNEKLAGFQEYILSLAVASEARRRRYNLLSKFRYSFSTCEL